MKFLKQILRVLIFNLDVFEIKPEEVYFYDIETNMAYQMIIYVKNKTKYP